jgi:hypothetical protein
MLRLVLICSVGEGIFYLFSGKYKLIILLSSDSYTPRTAPLRLISSLQMTNYPFRCGQGRVSLKLKEHLKYIFPTPLTSQNLYKG